MITANFLLRCRHLRLAWRQHLGSRRYRERTQLAMPQSVSCLSPSTEDVGRDGGIPCSNPSISAGTQFARHVFIKQPDRHGMGCGSTGAESVSRSQTPAIASNARLASPNELALITPWSTARLMVARDCP